MTQRSCKHCGVDISERHYHARICFGCMGVWGRVSGARKATAEVNKAINRGELVPAKQLKCVDCGMQAMSYDHRDYSQPLSVQPVCQSCNKLRGPAKHIAHVTPTQKAEAPHV